MWVSGQQVARREEVEEGTSLDHPALPPPSAAAERSGRGRWLKAGQA